MAKRAQNVIAGLLVAVLACSFVQASSIEACADDVTAEALPARFDLRDEGVVGPVRNQMPWGTCWAMSSVAASEMSILSEQGKSYSEYSLSLSPRHLAWFGGTALADAQTMSAIPSQAPYASQAGEGQTVRSSMINVSANPLENGGFTFISANLFAAGVGPVLESQVPYQNNENIAQYKNQSDTDEEWAGIGVLDNGQTIDEFLAEHPDGDYYAFTQLDEEGYMEPYRLRTGEVTAELIAADKLNVYAMEPIFDVDGTFIAFPNVDTPVYDWSVSEELRFTRSYELEEYHVLPQPGSGYEGDEYHYNEEATRAIKQELMAGRGVVASILDDSSGVNWGRANYTNPETWSQYTVDRENPNLITGAAHSICIVGWDDNWSADNFVTYSYDDEGEPIEWKPPYDGAWIVRNSYGAEGMGFPNEGDVGYLDENGQHTGYFYVSYYDTSLTLPASFDFDATGHISAYINQYDLMVAPIPYTEDYSEPTSAANVFVASADQLVHALSVETEEPNTHVVLKLVKLGAEGSNLASGEVLATAEADFEFGGFYRIELDERVRINEGERFAVVATLTTTGEDGTVSYHAPIHRDSNAKSIEKYGDAITSYVTAVVNAGESYLVSADGSMQDWSKLIEEGKQAGTLVAEYDYDNFSLKAYADEAGAEPQPEPGPVTPDNPEPQPATDANQTPSVQPASNGGSVPATGDTSSAVAHVMFFGAVAVFGTAFVLRRYQQ